MCIKRFKAAKRVGTKIERDRDTQTDRQTDRPTNQPTDRQVCR